MVTGLVVNRRSMFAPFTNNLLAQCEIPFSRPVRIICLGKRTTILRHWICTVAATTRRAKHFVYSEMPRKVQPLSQKYSSFRNTGTVLIYPSRPALTGGRVAIVTNVEGGMRWTLLVCEMMRTEAYGQAVWS